MLVVNNEQVVLVGWRYQNPELERLYILYDIEASEMKGKNQVEIIELLNEKIKENNREYNLTGTENEAPELKCLPKPSVTYCILSKGKEDIIKVSKVVKHKNDPYSKEKARSYSLTKVLHDTYPGPENKGVRRKFWEVYLNRNTRPELVTM